MLLWMTTHGTGLFYGIRSALYETIVESVEVL